jgi:hypothetical protein
LFFESLAAAFLLAATLFLWLVIAVIWGLIKTVLSVFSFLAEALNQDQFQWSQIWWIPSQSLSAGLDAACSVPSSLWHWAKFEYPWWAFLIALITVLIVSCERR